MSFLAVMRGFLQIAEHEGEEGKEGSADIIRLTLPVYQALLRWIHFARRILNLNFYQNLGIFMSHLLHLQTIAYKWATAVEC
jgi:hypothetical protein